MKQTSLNSYRLQLSYRIDSYSFCFPVTLEAVSLVHACATATVAVLSYFKNVSDFKAEELA